MKKNILQLCLGALAMMTVVACSGDSKMKALLEQVPQEMDAVLVGDFKTVIESAGGSIEDGKFKLPSAVADQLPSEAMDNLDDANSFLKNSGIDLEACALVTNYDYKQGIFIFALNDADSFLKAIDKEDFSEEEKKDDLVIYRKKTYQSDYDEDSKGYSYIAVHGDIAYYIPTVYSWKSFDAMETLPSLVSDLEKGNYADTPAGEYITEGNACGMAFAMPRELRSEMRQAGMPSYMMDLCSGFICLRGNIYTDEAELDIKFLDEDGQEIDPSKFKEMLDPNARINPEALAYLNADEVLVYAASLKDFNWDNYMEMFTSLAGMPRSARANVAVLKDYLSKIDGTVAVGMGLTDGLSSIGKISANDYSENVFSFTMVFETKEGKAKSTVSDLEALLEKAEAPVETTSGGFSVAISDKMTIYVKADGNNIVFSNKSISKNGDNPAVKAINFGDYLGAFALVLNQDSKLMRDLGLKNDLSLTVTSTSCTEGKLSLKVTGEGADGVIAKLFQIGGKLAKRGEDLEREIREQREEEIYSDDVDSVAFDTTAVATAPEIAE